MARKQSDRPTDSELAILRVLWESGDMTAKEIQQALKHKRNAAYTTTLTQLQFMHKKGLVVRDETQRSHVYRAAKSKSQTERSLVRSLIERSFGGSASSLVLYAIPALKKATPEEVERIKQLFRELEGEDK